jgi:integrase
MTRKRKRRSSIVEIGNGPARIKIYTMNRRDGYPEFTLSWKEAGRRKTRSFSSMDEARMIAQQTSVRLANGWTAGDEVTRRDIDLLRHCEKVAQEHGVALAAAIEEWASARKAAGEIPLADAVRFYRANRKDLLVTRTLAQVAEEFIESRRANGSSEIHVRNCKDYLGRLTGQMRANIADVTTADLSKFIRNQKTLGPVSRNALRGTIVSMFRFAKRQNYLHPDRDTVADMTEVCKVPETEITIYTPEEMAKMLLASHARLLPVLAIGAFAGIRTAEIKRLHWEDIKWDRGHIEIAGRKAKTASRRIVPLTENLKAWLAPWRDETGEIVSFDDVSGALGDVAMKAGIPGGWRRNALRHSFISYRVAKTGDVPRTALEAGNSPEMIFRHYRAVVDEQSAEEWFGIMPPEGWMPTGLKYNLRERMRRLLAQDGAPRVDTDASGQP